MEKARRNHSRQGCVPYLDHQIFNTISRSFVGCDAQTEIFTECGTACPATCENYQQTNRACTKQCVRGCFCGKGLVRRSDRKCVKPEECERMWHSNEMLTAVIASIQSLNAMLFHY